MGGVRRAVGSRLDRHKAATEEMLVEWKSERNSTRQCPNPNCKHHNRIKGRVYKCKKCGLKAHRDALGSWNILSFSMETCGLKTPVFKEEYVAISNQKYLAPVSMKGMRGKFLIRNGLRTQVASSAGQSCSAEDGRIMLPKELCSMVTTQSSCREASALDNDMDQTRTAGDVRKPLKTQITSVI